MKKQLSIYLFLVLLTILCHYCTDLESESSGDLIFERFPETEEQVIGLMGEAYRPLTNVGGNSSFWSNQSVSSDEWIVPQRGEEWQDGGMWLRLHRHQQRASDFTQTEGWFNLYGGINNTNRTLDILNVLSGNDVAKSIELQEFIAELKVLRAYYYWWLLDLYGNVPIITSYTDPPENPPNLSRVEVFQFVESELIENVPQLSREKSEVTYGRFNYWAGKALQARLYLNAEIYSRQSRWQEALLCSEEIINSGLYNLESNYFANFDANNQNSTENILIIPFRSESNFGFNWHMMSLHSESSKTFNLVRQPWNGFCVLGEFYNKYTDEDLRKGQWGDQHVRGNFLAGPQYREDGSPLIDPVVELSDPDGPEIVFTPEINEHFPNCLRQAGVRIAKYEFQENQSGELENDFVLFRYAEVLFNQAEAMYRMGSQDGLALVNLIRSRAGLSHFEQLNDTNILDERARELFGEGLRRTDLIRFGKWGDSWKFKSPSDPTKELMPIPVSAVDTNPNLVQNPGY